MYLIIIKEKLNQNLKKNKKKQKTKQKLIVFINKTWYFVI